MKNLIGKALMSRNAITSLLLVGGIFFLVGFACNTGDNSNTASNSKSDTKSSKSAIPAEDKLQTLAKTTMMDFSDAVQEGDFDDFYKKISKAWQDQTTPADLLDSFKVFVQQKEDYNFKKAIAPLDATLSPPPSIQQVAGLDALVLSGYYPTKPERANFELKYVLEDGNWKLIGVHIKTNRE
jgi:hypothetical protein